MLHACCYGPCLAAGFSAHNSLIDKITDQLTLKKPEIFSVNVYHRPLQCPVQHDAGNLQLVDTKKSNL